jgi:hypothetical protein
MGERWLVNLTTRIHILQAICEGSWARPLGGYEMLVRGDVLRGKFRESMSAPKPFVPRAATPLRFTLNREIEGREHRQCLRCIVYSIGDQTGASFAPLR